MHTSESARAQLTTAQRIVVKIGSNLVATPEGAFNHALLDSVVAEIAALNREGREVLLVTSGAVRLGLAKMGLLSGPRPDLSTRQAAAAVGQVELMACYNAAFARQGCTVGQLLLTGDDIADRRRYLHIRNTLLPLMRRHNVVPVINENDSTSVEGVQIGENDRLAALIAGKVQCDLLIILSDVEGLYTADPRSNPEATLLHEVARITPAMDAMAGGSTSGVGRGGMRSKLAAARIATRMGAHLVVALGKHDRVIARILQGEEVGTLFVARPESRVSARKQWLGFAANPQGTLQVDAGAASALAQRGSSLLPVGIREVEGDFQAGDVVSIVDASGREIARGLVNYGCDEIRQIAGQHTAQIEQILGYHPYDEAVHRDNLILL
ncbi:MAG: glutamate 5-kinase [Armatimonadota bacterium]